MAAPPEASAHAFSFGGKGILVCIKPRRMRSASPGGGSREVKMLPAAGAPVAEGAGPASDRYKQQARIALIGAARPEFSRWFQLFARPVLACLHVVASRACWHFSFNPIARPLRYLRRNSVKVAARDGLCPSGSAIGVFAFAVIYSFPFCIFACLHPGAPAGLSIRPSPPLRPFLLVAQSRALFQRANSAGRPNSFWARPQHPQSPLPIF